jgi:hypothetical protein
MVWASNQAERYDSEQNKDRNYYGAISGSASLCGIYNV